MYLYLFFYELWLSYSGSKVPQFKIGSDDDGQSKIIRFLWWDFTFNKLQTTTSDFVIFLVCMSFISCILYCAYVGMTCMFGG